MLSLAQLNTSLLFSFFEKKLSAKFVLINLESAWESHYKYNDELLKRLTPRATPRRLIHGIQVNHEFDLFEARLHTLQDTVDAYIVLESNTTTHGDPKHLLFLERLMAGWLGDYQSRLLYVFLSFFPEDGKSDGWYADHFLRKYLGHQGLRMVGNIR